MLEPKDKRTKEYKEWKFLKETKEAKDKIIKDFDIKDMPVYEAKYVGGDVKIHLTDNPIEGSEFVIVQETKTEDVGLGDVVKSITKATGIDRLVKAVVGDCGCEDRSKKWNKLKLFTKNLKPRCLTDEEFIEWGLFRNQQEWKVQGITLTHAKILYIWQTYQDVFNMKVAKPCTNCSPKPIMFMMENIDKLYNESK